MSKVRLNLFSLPDMSYSNTSVIIRAIHFEDVRQVKYLLMKGCDPNKPAGDKQLRPLMVACHVKNGGKRLAVFRKLLRHCADPELTDSQGQSSMMYVCALNLKDELQFILDNFICSFHNVDIHGNTLLHICAKYSSVDVLDLILKKMFQYSMNINIRNKGNYTPLDEAILQRNISCVEKLYQVGGQSTLLEDKIKDCISFSARAHRARSLPAVLKARRSPGKLSKLRSSDTQLQLPPINTKNSLSLPSVDTDFEENASSPNTSAYKKSTTTNLSPIPLKDTETILHDLLEMKGKRASPLYVQPTNEWVPLDSSWKSATHAHFKATQEWARENRRFTRTSEASIFAPAKRILAKQASIPQVRPSRLLWKKVLDAANKYKTSLKEDVYKTSS